VCTLGESTRKVQFEFVNGLPTIFYGELENLVPLQRINEGEESSVLLDPPNSADTYFFIYTSLANFLRGSVSFYEVLFNDPYTKYVNYSSNIALTGLDACDEFIDSYWQSYWNRTIEYFTKPNYMCRNRTLARAIEELSTNITISLLTSPYLT